MKQAFTLAEVLITLAIIGVVAAISIPSVISNSQQQEFKTGLRKAISVLNSAIAISMALDGESPYDNKDLFNYLTRHMNVLKTTTLLRFSYESYTCGNNGKCDDNNNAAFYTTDGMRFEFNSHTAAGFKPLHETNKYGACDSTNTVDGSEFTVTCGGCGSLGIKNNDMTGKVPCLIMVDVNGDKKPTPGNVNCRAAECALKSNLYKVPLPGEKKVRDIFSILITDEKAIPYGVTAQKAMYNSRK